MNSNAAGMKIWQTDKRERERDWRGSMDCQSVCLLIPFARKWMCAQNKALGKVTEGGSRTESGREVANREGTQRKRRGLSPSFVNRN